MSNTTSSHRPPSPPHSNSGDYEVSTGSGSHFSEPYTPPRTVRPASRAEMTYGTYAPPSPYPPVPQPVYYSPQPTFVRQMPYHTPPHAAEIGIMTRSGKSLGSPLDSKHARDGRNNKPRKSRSLKIVKKGVPMIDQPLSSLTKDYKIPVRDMGAWVNRPVEERLQEVEKKKGYVSRPMNSFMLYRSAYAERVKQFCKENNHQVVSQVTGQSWPLEPPQIREMYEQYAILERDNHAAAHPTYKFAPNKNGKKRGRDDDDDEEDSDDEWRRPGSSKRSRASTRFDSRSLSSTPFDPDRTMMVNVPVYHSLPLHPAVYQSTNQSVMQSYGYGHGQGQPPMTSGYYHPAPVQYAQPVDDSRFNGLDDVFANYDTGSQLIGMPNNSGGELFGASNVSEEQMLDPRLATFESSQSFAMVDPAAENSVQVPQTHGYSAYPPPDGSSQVAQQIYPGMATLTDAWPEGMQIGSDFDTEFQTWS